MIVFQVNAVRLALHPKVDTFYKDLDENTGGPVMAVLIIKNTVPTAKSGLAYIQTLHAPSLP
jgi:hypothetical protein